MNNKDNKDYILIKVTEKGCQVDYNGDAFLLLLGLAEAAAEVINEYPIEIQQKARVLFMETLNKAYSGELSQDANS